MGATTTWELKADDMRAGLTLGRLREFLAALDGAPDETPVKATAGFRHQLQAVTVDLSDP